MATKTKNTMGSKKRLQIQDTERNIFVWLSVSAVVICACIVAIQFLVREAIFNQGIIGEKIATEKQLTTNIANAATLRKNIDDLIADESLGSVSRQELAAEGSDRRASNLSAILDALPTSGDPTTFATSLQLAVLPKSGVSVKELSTGAEGDVAAGGSVAGDSLSPQLLGFTVGFSGSYENTTKALSDMSRVIRPLSLTGLTIKAASDNELTVDVKGNTYYMPAKSIQVTKEKRER